MNTNLTTEQKKHVRIILVPAFIIGLLVIVGFIYFTYRLAAWGVTEMLNANPLLDNLNLPSSTAGNALSLTLIAISLFSSRRKTLNCLKKYWKMALGEASFLKAANKE